MTASLVDDLTSVFRSQALGDASTQLGESESSVLKGFQAAAAAILGSLAGRSGQPGFMSQAFDLISNPLNDSKILDNVRGLFSSRSTVRASEGLGGRLLSMLFGGNQAAVSDKISQASGLRSSSASTLMSFAAPVVLALLGRKVRDGHLDVSGFSSLLQRETTGIRSLLPAGLSSLMGMAPTAADETRYAVERTRPNRWLWPVLGLIVAIVALLWFLGRNQSRVAQVVRDTAGTVQTTASSVGDFMHTVLGNGVDLNIPRSGTEAKLLEFIRDTSRPVDNTTWFDFDRLSFDSNSATLRSESQEQLNNIAAILKAYPTLRLKIGGYTDNTGDPAANLRLSQARADSVRQQLIAMGIGSERLEAEG